MTFKAKKLHDRAWAVMVGRTHGQMKVEFAIYESYGGMDGQSERAAKRVAKALNDALKAATK